MRGTSNMMMKSSKIPKTSCTNSCSAIGVSRTPRTPWPLTMRTFPMATTIWWNQTITRKYPDNNNSIMTAMRLKTLDWMACQRAIKTKTNNIWMLIMKILSPKINTPWTSNSFSCHGFRTSEPSKLKILCKTTPMPQWGEVARQGEPPHYLPFRISFMERRLAAIIA